MPRVVTNSEWTVTRLGDIAEFRNGVNYNRDSFGEGVKVVGVKDFKDYSKPRFDELEQINPEGVVTAKSILRDGDIIFVRSNGNRELIGRSLFIERPLEEITHSAFTIRLRFISEKVCPKFYAYLFRAPYIRKGLTAFGGGTNISNLNQDILGNLEVPLPPIPVQKRITEVLSAYDELIENNQRRIRILEEMARSLYREWFVHFRYPGHENIPLVDSPLGPIPQGWEVKKVGDLLVKVTRQKKVKKQDYIDHGALPVIDQGRELIGGFTDNLESTYTSDLPVVVFGDHTRVMKFIDFPFACGADGTQLLQSTDERMPTGLLYYTVSNIDLSNYGYARHFKFLKEEGVIVPSVDVAKVFTGKVGQMRKHMSVLQKQMDNLRNTRDLVLPKLLSGEIDSLSVEEGA